MEEIMDNIFNSDFRDFIASLNLYDVEYILVGGYSVILHGYSGTTGDLDIWVNKTAENYNRLKNTFHYFGMPVFDMTESNFLTNNNLNVFSFGRLWVSIDIITEVKDLNFKETFTECRLIEMEGLSIRLIPFNFLIKAKKSA